MGRLEITCISSQGVLKRVPAWYPGPQHIVLLVQRLPQCAGRHAFRYACMKAQSYLLSLSQR